MSCGIELKAFNSRQTTIKNTQPEAKRKTKKKEEEEAEKRGGGGEKQKQRLTPNRIYIRE